mmetsp:Transcript_95460/g.204841  ORF Transcript_95460/g.204841 Transcript_95460/m.204841 type:complete len:452 (+) Transcript_95460:212-1567(+)
MKQGMLVIRNTFVDLAQDYDYEYSDDDTSDLTVSRRSRSAPRTWKPMGSCSLSMEETRPPTAGVLENKSSTVVSERDASPSSDASTADTHGNGSQLGDREPSTENFLSLSDDDAGKPDADFIREGDQEENSPAARSLPLPPTETVAAKVVAPKSSVRWKHVVKRQPSSNTCGGSVARLNALDLCFGKPFHKPKCPEPDLGSKERRLNKKPARHAPVVLLPKPCFKRRPLWSDEEIPEWSDEEVPAPKLLSPEAHPSEPVTDTTTAKDMDEGQMKAPIRLSLSSIIPEKEVAASTPLVLIRYAQVISPESSFLAEVCSMVSAMQSALLKCANICSVEISEVSVRGTTILTFEMHQGPLQEYALVGALESAKAALLKAATTSTSTYVVGYRNSPFKDLGGEGFDAVLGFVPVGHESTTCMETLEQGFCPRGSTCRWFHPSDDDLAYVRVVLRK